MILSIVAFTVVNKTDGIDGAARSSATLEELELLARAICGNPALHEGGARTDFGYVGDVGALPSSLSDLETNPGGYSTWRGPYISESYNNDYLTDGWGATYSYSGGVTISSSGSGSTITKQFAESAAELTSNSISGVVRDGLKIPPGSLYRDSVTLLLQYPDGTGGMTTATSQPSASGSFSFSGVPIGNHLLRVVNNPTNDTLEISVSVLPNSAPVAALQFGAPLW